MIKQQDKQHGYLFYGHDITVSTFITLVRIVLVPFIIMSMMREQWCFAYGLFLLAAITDVLDGALARYLQQQTELGAYLDPLADKILLVSCYAGLAFVRTPLFKIPLWFLVVMFLKEFFLIIGAIYLGLIKKILVIKPAFVGKLTTVVQVVFIWWLFTSASLGSVSYVLFDFFIYFLTLLMVITFGYYVYKAYVSCTLFVTSKKI